MDPPIATHIKGQAANDMIKGIEAANKGLFVAEKTKYVITPIPINVANIMYIFFNGFLVLLQDMHIFDT
jgi:hypothetical protein